MHTILYWINRKDVSGPPPERPENDPQFEHWEAPVQDWWVENSWKYKKVTLEDKPLEIDNIHTSLTKPIIEVLQPNEIENYKIILKNKIADVAHNQLDRLFEVNDEENFTRHYDITYDFTITE